MKFSYSGLKNYITCPRQFYELKVAKNYRQPETEQTKYGSEVHEALEKYIRDGEPLLENYQRFKPVVDELLTLPGARHVEQRMALRANKAPCEFDDPDYWVRGIVDFMVIEGDTAHVVDWKTGSAKYPDPRQLKLMALMVFEHFPQVQTVHGALIFLLAQHLTPGVYERKNKALYWGDFAPDLMRMEMSYRNNVWPENPSGLCRKHCNVLDCAFYGSGGRRR